MRAIAFFTTFIPYAAFAGLVSAILEYYLVCQLNKNGFKTPYFGLLPGVLPIGYIKSYVLLKNKMFTTKDIVLYLIGLCCYLLFLSFVIATATLQLLELSE